MPLVSKPKINCPELAAYLTYMGTEQMLAPTTIKTRLKIFERIERHLNGINSSLALAGAEDFKSFLRTQSSAGQSSGTLGHYVSIIFGFLRFLCSTGIDRNKVILAIDRPKKPENLPRPLSRAQVVQLLSRPPVISQYYIRDLAMLELLYASGLRAAELVGLKLLDINLTTCWVRVTGKGNKDRIVPFGTPARNALLVYLNLLRPRLDAHGHEHVFLSKSGKPISRSALYWLVSERAKTVGLKPIGPHVLRHTFATHLLCGGANVRVIQQLMGHNSVDTTQIYLKVDSARLKMVHSQFLPR